MASRNGSGKAVLVPEHLMLPRRPRSLCTLANTLRNGGGGAEDNGQAPGGDHSVSGASVAPAPVRSPRPVSGA